MQINQLVQSLPYYFGAKIVPCLVAPHGVGKSSVVHQYAENNNLGFVDIRLGQMTDPGDLTGLPQIENGQTKFFATNLLPRSGKGVLFLDEINRPGKDLLQCIFQLVLDRRLNDYELPKGWDIVAAMNPDGGEYSVTSFDDQAFLDRFAMIRIEPSVEEFTHYMRGKNYSRIADFITENPNFLERKIDFSVNVTPSRRSWEFVSRIHDQKLPDNLRLPVYSSIVGVEAAASFIQYLDSKATITWEDIYTRYGDDKKLKEDVKALDAGAFSVLMEQAEAWSIGHGDYGMGLDPETAEELPNYQDFVEYEKRIVKFLKDIPKDYAYAFIYEHIIKSPSSIYTPSEPELGWAAHPDFDGYFDHVQMEKNKEG